MVAFKTGEGEQSKVLSRYDLNGNHQLDTGELCAAPAADIVAYVRSLPTPSKQQEVLKEIRNLPLPKLVQIFKAADASSLWSNFFQEIAKQNATTAAQIVVQMLIPFSAAQSRNAEESALLAAGFLLKFPEAIKTNVLAMIQHSYPDDYTSVMRALSQLKDGQATSDTSPFKSQPVRLQQALKTPNSNLVSEAKSKPIDAVYVNQGEYILTRPNENRFLMTDNLSVCICVILRDPVTKITVMAHLDRERANADAIDMMIQDLKSKGVPAERLQGQVYGAVEMNVPGLNTKQEAQAVIGHIRSYGIQISHQNVGYEPKKREAFSAIVFDVQLGKASYYHETSPQNGIKPPPPGIPVTRSKKSWGQGPYAQDL